MPVEAFSLYPHHIEWVKNQPKGKRSAAVRRAIDYWRHSGQISETRHILQERVLELDSELEMTAQVWGRRVTLAFFCGLGIGLGVYILSYALNLLEYA